MSEAFPAFGQSYRAFYTSLLTFSSSGIAGLLLIATKEVPKNYLFLVSYRFGITLFLLCILAAITSNFVGLYHEAREGMTSNSLQQRQINRLRFKILYIAVALFLLGLFAFGFAAWPLVGMPLEECA